MKFLSAFFVAAGLGQLEAAVDMGGLKLDGLADGMKLPDLSGLTGGKGGVSKDGKGGFEGTLPFFVAPPSINSSVPIFSTDTWSVDFVCQQVEEPGSEEPTVTGFVVVNVKSPSEDFAFISAVENPVSFGDVSACDSLEEVSAGTDFTCVINDQDRSNAEDVVFINQTDVTGVGSDGAAVKFSDGSKFIFLEDQGTFLLTGLEGNDTLETVYGAPSSCAAYGFVYVDVPKGLGFSSTGAFEGEPKKKAGSDSGFFKDGGLPDLFKFGDFELPSFGLDGLGLGGGKGGDLKSAGPFTGILSYYLNSPSLNSTIPVFKSEFADIEFSCLEQTDGSDISVYAAYAVTLKGGKKGITVAKPGIINFDDSPPPVFAQPCDDFADVLTLAPGESITCFIGGRSTLATETEVFVSDADTEITVLFSNGLQIGTPDDGAHIARTGTMGNSNFTEFFGAKSSCATFGPLALNVPKGIPFEIFSDPPKGGKTVSAEKEDKDTPFKLEGLSDSVKLDFDLSGLSQTKGKGVQPKDVFQYHVSPPSLNTTSNIFSTDFASLDFACATGELEGDKVIGLYLLTINAPEKEDIEFLVDQTNSDEDPFGIEACEDVDSPDGDLKVVPAGTTLTCFIDIIDTEVTNTDVEADGLGEFGVQFSNGFHFTTADDGVPTALTGVPGTPVFAELFDIPSSCTGWGSIHFLEAKGVKLNLQGSESMAFP
uniref:Uncharacterized protein n=1 Tax=Chromera velia CCMP2878 TaxID=1169474 RepID=A0A0G4H460_9ALVE|mmetsp:Transcript_54088/g.105849  ORF Transcript_54088/g.105849 Transcript_54088/m.105849 type:complete len:708 (-) Transcript_54088:917-3040(-)|eukprot:Cvel_24595.t1-p1 / transcript=Cvel_24595.t1 / gene=Cvel_24595 / organism=Chromera_velia_CCMP2878 / gene_product=hypothetical protein / transcript_product=hypothetical protein / location=Cvel_scaffold2678:18870-23006(-) / protein_length=707 / sequence_SO=supercontig / SO=protein_coding / is_pseudo=false